MKFRAIPTLLVSVESGHKFGPPLMCETTPLENSAPPDNTRNVVVVTVQDLMRTVAVDLDGQGQKYMLPLAFHPHDALKLCIDLLLHLASMGDKGATFLCEQLQHIPYNDG